MVSTAVKTINVHARHLSITFTRTHTKQVQLLPVIVIILQDNYLIAFEESSLIGLTRILCSNINCRLLPTCALPVSIPFPNTAKCYYIDIIRTVVCMCPNLVRQSIIQLALGQPYTRHLSSLHGEGEPEVYSDCLQCQLQRKWENPMQII